MQESASLTKNPNLENGSEISLQTFLEKKPLGTIIRSKILIESSIFNVYYFLTEDNCKIFRAKRCLSGFEIFDSNSVFICKMRANIFGTKYSVKHTNSIEIKYESSFLEKGKPRSFKIKIDGLELINKKPYFNTETNSFSLNFSGRVTKPSVKNFQIIHPLEPTYITLTFGKEEQNSYILDFTYPWSALNAFCVGLSALDHKYGCD